ncbi:MAG: type 4a pilus biogenesis protein PilO [Neisseria sp.]|nr:type 4a pilus biogenesis protein PilO [Neisseria sp.]
MKKSSYRLDFNNLHNSSIRLKFLLAAALFAGVFGVLYLLLLQTPYQKLQTAYQQEADLKNLYQQQSIQFASFNTLKKELQQLHQNFDDLLKQLPTEDEIPNLIQELHQAASRNHLSLNSLTPLPSALDEAEQTVQTLSYQLSITGNYAQISQFVRDVGQLQRIITLDNLQIQSNEQGLLTLSARANTYRAQIQAAPESPASHTSDAPAEQSPENAAEGRP